MHSHQHASAIDDSGWKVLVDATLPDVWSTMQRSALSDEDMRSVCELVFIRLYEEVAAANGVMPEHRTVRATVRTITIEECERARRLAAWRGTGQERSANLTASRQQCQEWR